MTPEERSSPEVIDSSRRRRIAGGSGTNTQEVNQLLKQFRQMKKVMKQLSESGMMKRMSPVAAGRGLFSKPRRRKVHRRPPKRRR